MKPPFGRLAQSFDADQVLRVIKQWYRTNDDKLAVLLRDNPIVTRGPNHEKFNSICFKIDGVCVSTKLLPPTPEARVTVALRDIEYQTRPGHLKRPGYEMDHQNEGGFAAIKQTFIDLHGTEKLCKSLFRKSLNEADTLPQPLYGEFVELHAKMTENYTLCKLLTKEEHMSLTQARQRS